MKKDSIGNKYSQEDLDDPILRDVYLDQVLDYDSMPTKETLDQKVHSGELVYVSEYTRGDGTKVSGYYRSYPNNLIPKKTLSEMTTSELDELLDKLL